MNVKKTALVLVLFVIVFLSVSYLSYPLVGPDSGYYLATAREFYNGNVYFIDIATAYNPLAIIILGIPFLFSAHPDPRYSLIINMFIIWLSAFVFYSILQKIKANKNENVFYALFFVLGSLLLDGSYLMLEPISVFFQLTGLLFYLKNKESNATKYLFFAGVAFALSFLSKQYGLFILAPIGIAILINKKQIIKKIVLLTIGFLIPISVFYCYLSSNGAGFIAFINYIFGKGIHLDKGNGTGINYNLTTYLIGFGVFVLYNLYVLFIPVLFFKNRKNFDYKSLLFISIFPFSLLVLLSASYAHYFQYVLPYALIAFAYLSYTFVTPISKNKEVVFLISIVIMSAISVVSYSRKQNKIDLQEATLQQLSSVIPNKSEVYLDGISPAFYYLCDYKSIQLNTVGFTFPGYFYPKTIVQNMEKNSFLVVSKEAYLSYKSQVGSFSKKIITVNNQTFFVLKKE